MSLSFILRISNLESENSCPSFLFVRTMQGSSARSLVNPLKKLQRKEDLEKEFVESGEKDRVQEIVERRLHESGWAKRVESMCEEYIAKKGYDRVELQAMVDDLKDASRRIVPDEVKRELMQLIQEFVNSRTSTGEKW